MRSITLEFISDIPGKGEHDLYHMGQNCVYRREKDTANIIYRHGGKNVRKQQNQNGSGS